MKIDLVKSPVIFDEETHTYTMPDGAQLMGITGMLKRQLFPDKYSDIPLAVMEKARERGHRIHKDIEYADSTGFSPETFEGLSYEQLREEAGYDCIANEYTVSDEAVYASNIDCVWKRKEDDSIALVDIKTTYNLDEEYVSWQLSIYAYLFELQNPNLKVSDLYACWLYNSSKRRKIDLVRVARKSKSDVTMLLECEYYGTPFLELEKYY